MKKTKILLSALALIILLSLSGCNNNEKNTANSKEPENVFVSAKTDLYESIEELENASDLIVIGTKVKELESNVVYDENEVYQIAYTYSSFQIDEIVSNKVKESNKEITIFENQAYDKKYNQILHIEGYTNMLEGNKYILYLELAEEGYYIPLALTAGKVPLTNSEINGTKLKMKNARDYIPVVAACDLPVMIYGETGTGKEVFAQSIHNASERRDKPFIAQNCAALPDTLLESILFGTSKGAFTGAMENKGLFELADGGTLFLDEINSMPLFLQSKLLRVLQDGSFRSLGGSETKRTNVKIIAATNVEPLEAIEKGQLRRDIYYRLSMMSIRIPPLRERKADIGHFVKFYVNKHNGTFHKQVQYVSKDLLKKLEEYDWPGNVRELEHVIVYGMSMVDETSALLQYKDIKGKLLLEKQADRKKTPESLEEVPKLCSSLREAVAAYEEKLIWQALEAAHGNISEAARILDVPRQTLQRKASQLRGEKAKEKQEKEI